jgi:Penicillin binding protein A dimerisation domain/Penicillin binding protein transpeptidase domain/Caspase domain
MYCGIRGSGGFEVRTLFNEPAHVVNLAVEEFFADRRPGDLLVVHFSGHGVKDEDGELYFAASNTVLGRLGATAVAAEFVSRRMSRSRSRRVVLLLDCCYAGAFERGLVARAGDEMGIEQQFGGRGRAVITASSAMEYAFEGGELADARELAPSVFTSALVQGLRTGEADRDQDGLVGLDELYDYVYDKVRAATPNQTPGKWTFGVEGALYIARRARPVSVPAPLPPELQQAIESPLAGIRSGAVQELTGLLRGRHAGMALAARMALEQLTDDDSRTVAAAAIAALRGPASATSPEAARPVLALSATIINFGALRQHAQSPERRVRIANTGGGSLNARAVTSASWLSLRQAGDELVVAVDTSAAGEHEGTVAVDSDGGSAAIRIQARVEPALLRATKATVSTTGGLVPASAGESLSAEEKSRTRPTTGIASGADATGAAAAATRDSRLGGGQISTGQRAWFDPGSGDRLQPAQQPRHRTVSRPSIKPAAIRGHRRLVIALAGAVLVAAGVVPVILTGSLGHQTGITIDRRGSIVTADGVTIAESTPSNDIYKYQRKYPNGPEYAPVTGYHTLHSESGFEAAENSVLRGNLVTLTLNSKAQDAAYNALKALGKPGGVVALNPKTGAILAMASYPSYDPNVLATHNGTKFNKADRQLLADKTRPLLNRALQATYPPGSTFKIVTSSALLTQSPSTTINTNVDSPTTLTLPQTQHILHNDQGWVSPPSVERSS